MNTFVCEPGFAASAARLDRLRLGKQRLEVWQMLRALTGATHGWAHHPAVLAWTGHAHALAEFGLACHTEWVNRGYLDTTADRLRDYAATLPDTGMPWWVGDDRYLQHVRSVLITKNPDRYGPMWPGTPIGLGNYWPTQPTPSTDTDDRSTTK